MSGHYSNIYDTLRNQETKQMQKEIKQLTNKLSYEDLQLIKEIISELRLYKNFFEGIKRISIYKC